MASVVSFMYKIFKSLVGAILLSIGAIVMFPVLLILFVVRRIAISIIYFRFGNSVNELFGTDLIFAFYTMKNNPFVINAFLKIDRYLNFEEFKHLIQNKIESDSFPNSKNVFRKFKQTLENYYGYYVWKDVDNFDINNHIKKINLSELYPGEAQNIYKANSLLDNSCADILPLKYLNEHGSRPFLENLPLWEILILTQEGSSDDVILLRLNHSIGDGLSLFRLLNEELADEPTTISFPKPSSIGTFEKIVSFVWSITLIPFAILKLMLSRKNNPLHGADLNEKKIYVTSKDIPFEIVKSIKKATETSATDILLSSLSSSLASFFQTRSVEVSDIEMVFVNGKNDSTTEIILSNTFSCTLGTLPTLSTRRLKEISSDKMFKYPYSERLKSVKKKMNKLRSEPTNLALEWFKSVMASILPSSLGRIISTPRGSTLLFTNLPGPHTDIYICGKKIKGMCFWVPVTSPVGVGLSFITYKGQLRLSFNIDTALISYKEAEKLIEDFIIALEELLKEVNEKNY